VDVNLSNDDDVVPVPKPNAPVIQKGSASDGVGDDGVTSATSIAPSPISSAVPEQSKPSTADWVLAIVPPSGRRWRKRPSPAIKRSKPITLADQVMSQVELPPYYGPHSPLDLIAIEIIFGRIFEAFRQISQAANAGAVAIDVDKLLKRVCHLPMRKALMPQ
jgi:hypothetical protein